MSFPNLKKWAFFYFSPDFHPSENTARHCNKDDSCSLITVGFSPSAKQDGSIIKIAKQLKDEGVQNIELCGGFGPEWQYKISEALNFEIPIGCVYYGPECRSKLLKIMKPNNEVKYDI